MDLRKLQDDITEWGRETFGEHPPLGIAARANVEMAELLNGLANREATTPGSLDRVAADDRLADECADVFIVLVQVCSALERDLADFVDTKMMTNRARVWTKNKHGANQHARGFKWYDGDAIWFNHAYVFQPGGAHGLLWNVDSEPLLRTQGAGGLEYPNFCLSGREAYTKLVAAGYQPELIP